GSSLSTTFRVQTYGKHMFSCKTICGPRKKVICGIDIQSASPPEEPQNVSCIQHGTQGHPMCTWNKGSFTYLHTTYVLQ
ncbi:I12R2 protein, partial [Bucco capensis]|nr:I12R2 protein [Bucco capensis]